LFCGATQKLVILFTGIRYFLIFEAMSATKTARIQVKEYSIQSEQLCRKVIVDFYRPIRFSGSSAPALLLINDGQDLRTMHFEEILEKLYETNALEDILCIGIHCGKDRKNEYGTARVLDYKGRGARAALYTRFVFEELLPYIRRVSPIRSFKEKAFAGFSLGGLCALDIVWNHPEEFTKTGVFSGSLWWRDKDQADEDFDENTDRIMHRQVREQQNTAPWLKFFFEVGTLDETADRNNNGVIDAIDDTVSLIDELVKKGYNRNSAIKFLELKNGKHDVPTWAKAFPDFLKWGWGKQ
jgi:enterochelin esterase-like enzyme